MSKSKFSFEEDDYSPTYQTVPMEPTGSSGGYKPTKKSQGKAFGHYLMLPIEWTTKSVKWLTNPTAKGGGQYVVKVAAFGCLLLTVENTYQLFAGNDSVRFIPKPMVNDNAQISRVLPLGDVGNAVVGTLADGANLFGANIGRPQPFTRADLLVWTDGRFLAALAFAFLLNTVEAMILRRVSLASRVKQLSKAKSQDKQVQSAVKSFGQQAEDFKSLETITKETQIKTYGNGRLIFLGTVLLSCYAFEAWSFFATAIPGTPFVMSSLLAFASIFGAEGLWNLSEYMEEREVDESK